MVRSQSKELEACDPGSQGRLHEPTEQRARQSLPAMRRPHGDGDVGDTRVSGVTHVASDPDALLTVERTQSEVIHSVDGR